MKGLVTKKHSNFYYVKTEENLVYECMLRDKLKKGDKQVCVGDYVQVENIENEAKTAVISDIERRNSFISRPIVANIDLNIIVMSITKPALSYLMLDRFIIHSQLCNVDKLICINKIDLKDKKSALEAIRSIYDPLGIPIIPISAKTNQGIEILKEKLKSKISVFSGPSGVGKSTILNSIMPGLNLRIGIIGSKSQQGTHTTRHIELIDLDYENSSGGMVADTPGFSYLKFDKYLPEEIERQYPEFIPFKQDCHYNNCLHINEDECGVKTNLDNIHPFRYESYRKFIDEAFQYKARISSESIKDEGKTKTVNTSGQSPNTRLKLGLDLVEESRKKSKQKLSSMALIGDNEELFEENID